MTRDYLLGCEAVLATGEVIRAGGKVVKDVAGYDVLRLLCPRDSARILDDKLDEIEAASVDLVVAVNPGCLRQLQTGLRRRRSSVRAVHLAELLTDDHGHHGGAS